MMAAHQLIVGGQRSGKSRHAEALALRWLRAAATHRVSVLATAAAHDEEMRSRIARHRADRPAGFATLEEQRHLSQALAAADAPGHLVVVDCLTLWLSNWLMPFEAEPDLPGWQREQAALLALLPRLQGPVLFVSNEVGWGVSPLSSAVRHYVDELGRLNQAIAARCADLTLMVAGQAWSRPVEAELP